MSVVQGKGSGGDFAHVIVSHPSIERLDFSGSKMASGIHQYKLDLTLLPNVFTYLLSLQFQFVTL